MSAIVEQLEIQDAFTVMGTVDRTSVAPAGAPEGEAVLYVVSARGTLRCQRAAGCLIAPAKGDYVLVAGAPTGRCYVLAVLERDDPSKTTMALDGDVDLNCSSGRLRIAAKDGVEILTPKELVLAAADTLLQSKRGRVVVEELSCLASAVVGEFGRVRTEATSLDTLVERLTLRAKNSFRRIQETDQLDAKRMDYSAKETIALRSDSTCIAATNVVKVDGEQILMG